MVIRPARHGRAAASESSAPAPRSHYATGAASVYNTQDNTPAPHPHTHTHAKVSAKDLSTALELLAASSVLLRYRPSVNCTAEHARYIRQGQDAYAASLIKRRWATGGGGCVVCGVMAWHTRLVGTLRTLPHPATRATRHYAQHNAHHNAQHHTPHRLRALYFHLSSGNRSRSNAALALLAVLAGRGGTVLRELVAAFDFSHSSLPKLARPPKHALQTEGAATTPAAAAAAADGRSAHGQQQGGVVAAAAPAAPAAAGVSSGRQQQQPLHWAGWHSPQMGRRPSRALFVEWGECAVCVPAVSLCLGAGVAALHHTPCTLPFVARP